MFSGDMHIQICTWNAGQVLNQQKTLALSTWLADDQLFDEDPPAMFAFGFQFVAWPSQTS